jgi:hypothetical protein
MIVRTFETEEYTEEGTLVRFINVLVKQVAPTGDEVASIRSIPAEAAVNEVVDFSLVREMKRHMIAEMIDYLGREYGHGQQLGIGFIHSDNVRRSLWSGLGGWPGLREDEGGKVDDPTDAGTSVVLGMHGSNLSPRRA